jgi:pimeloyl-ACP methyl ester carboxylesterase
MRNDLLQVSLGVRAPARRGAVHVTPERRMAWSEWGPTNGAPVLFSPGAATSSSLGFAADALERLGARLIAVDRPGLGGSEAAPNRTLLDGAADVRALAAALSLERPAIVGFSQGAPLALACAAAGAVSAAAVVSGTDELAGAALRGLLAPPALQRVELAETDPSAAEAMFRGATPAMLIEMVNGSAEVDLAVYRNPVFAEAFASGVAEGFVQGPDGFARDALLAMQRWPFDPAQIQTPVHLWYGALDTSPFHSPDHGVSLARRIPGAARTLIEGAGGAILWIHGAEILASLLEARHRAAS